MILPSKLVMLGHMSTKIPYLIVTPWYRYYSAGVRMLHALCHHLNENGYKAYVNTDCINLDWNEESCSAEDYPFFAENGIIVYPEVVKGNPLNGKIVVRYILNHPGWSGGDKEYPFEDILFTCNKETLGKYVPDGHILCIPLIEDFFRDERLQRNGGCFFVGKGVSVPRIPETKGMKEIIGMNREEVARTLKTSTILITYDNFSLIIEEAKKCGCPVRIVGEEISRVSYDDYTKNFEKQLVNFIQITQSVALKRMEEKDGNNSNWNL